MATAYAGYIGGTSGFMNSRCAAGLMQRTDADVQLSKGKEIGKLSRMCPRRERDPWERWVGEATALGTGYPTTHCHCVLAQHCAALLGVNSMSFWQNA